MEKTSCMIATSIVDDWLTHAGSPFGAIKLCSGEVDGLVSRYPSLSSISQLNRNETHPSIMGYALYSRKSCREKHNQNLPLLVLTEC